MKSVLFIAKMDKFKEENSSNRFFFLRFLAAQPNIQLMNDERETSYRAWAEASNRHPDVVIYYFLSSYPAWTRIDIPDFDTAIPASTQRLMVFEDHHYTDIVVDLFRKHRFDKFIMLGYHHATQRRLRAAKIPWLRWNQYFDTSKFKNHHRAAQLTSRPAKEYDFVFYGFRRPQIYPLREKIYQALCYMKRAYPAIRIHIVEHPGYTSKDHTLPTNERLSQLLSSGRFAFATMSVYSLFLKKYGEISLSGATVIGDIPEGHETILRGNIIELRKAMSLRQIVEILLKAHRGGFRHIEARAPRLVSFFQRTLSYEQGYTDLMRLL